MIVSHPSAPTVETSGFLLAEYAKHLNYDWCSFFGVRRWVNHRHADTVGCTTVWTQAERNNLAWYLCEAQRELEHVTKWPLSTKYFVDEEVIAYNCPDYVKWHRVQAIGVQAFSDVGTATVDYSTEPATVIVPSVAANGMTVSAENVRIYEAGTDNQLVGIGLTDLNNGSVQIDLMRCLMVAEGNHNTTKSNLVNWDDLFMFVDEVDIKIEYVEPRNGQLICSPRCCGQCGCQSATSCEATGIETCVHVEDPYTGLVTAPKPIEKGCRCRCNVQKLKLSYAAGDRKIAKDSILAIRWLAHAKMPKIPCSCEMLQAVYAEDRKRPDTISHTMTQAAFGIPLQGAYSAYWWAYHNRGIRLLSWS